MTDTLPSLTLTDRPTRDAVLHLITSTSLVDSVHVVTTLGGKVTTASLVRPYGTYSAGERLLWLIAASLVHRTSDAWTLADIPRQLDAESQRAVIAALRMLCRETAGVTV